jgi:hypothetical protein
MECLVDSFFSVDKDRMNKARHTLVNDRDNPIYITIEPTPECYELEPGETLTLIYNVQVDGDALSIRVIDEGMVVWSMDDEPEILVNGADAQGRSWKFKHYGRRTI